MQDNQDGKFTTEYNKFTPAIGGEFDIYRAEPELIEAITELETTRTRNRLAILITSFLLGTLVASAAYGIVDGDIQIVAATWAAVSTTLTLILNYYFKRRLSKQ